MQVGIPDKGEKSWSLFLICNPEWLLPESQDKLKALYDRFVVFGDSIGPEHAAVWFYEDGRLGGKGDRLRGKWWPITADVYRSRTFCSKLNLQASRSPYVLFSADYPGEGYRGDPDSINELNNFTVLVLNNANSSEIMRILNDLADQLLKKEISKINISSESY